jgi:hypothetical protein
VLLEVPVRNFLSLNSTVQPRKELQLFGHEVCTSLNNFASSAEQSLFPTVLYAKLIILINVNSSWVSLDPGMTNTKVYIVQIAPIVMTDSPFQ